jgi:cation transport ATPase
MANPLSPYAFLVGLIFFFPGNAFATQERIALMLTGPACTQVHSTISRTLEQTAGVRRVDLQAVPDHALIDIEPGTVTAEALEHQVNDLLATHPSCRADIMKSCISADPRSANTAVP